MRKSASSARAAFARCVVAFLSACASSRTSVANCAAGELRRRRARAGRSSRSARRRLPSVARRRRDRALARRGPAAATARSARSSSTQLSVDRRRREHERGPELRAIEQQRDRLHRLAEAHVVGEHAARAPRREPAQQAQALASDRGGAAARSAAAGAPSTRGARARGRRAARSMPRAVHAGARVGEREQRGRRRRRSRRAGASASASASVERHQRASPLPFAIDHDVAAAFAQRGQQLAERERGVVVERDAALPPSQSRLSPRCTAQLLRATRAWCRSAPPTTTRW